ncbi:MAG TPA: FtsX-like permease family protein [Puia sp.]|nr:FtsX-like permease family protein [Puia sp.]
MENNNGLRRDGHNGPRRGWLLTMAWRDSRRNRGRLLLFISSVVLGIAALVATLSFGNNLRDDIDDQAKELVGADLVIRGRHRLPDSVAAIKVLAQARRSEDETMASMVYFPRSQSSRLVQLIGLQGDYPYYGRIETRPASAATEFRGKREALVDQTLMLEFGARVGDSVRVGTLYFTIAGALIKMPGRNQVSLTVAAPVYIPLRYVDSAGLEKRGSEIGTEVYYQFGPATDVPKLMTTLGPALDSAHVRYETVEMRKKRMTRVFDDLSQFLTLISFIALLLGCIGVASSVNIYIREKIAGVAVLRCLGLKARQAFLIYLIQVTGIGLIGSLLGAALGVLVQQILPLVFKDILPVEAHFRLSWPAIGEGVGTGMVIALLFALLPLLTVRKVSPLNTLRLSVETVASGWDGWKAAVYAGVFCFIAWFSYVRMGKLSKALIFTVSILAAFLLLAGAARLLMAAVRRFFPQRWGYLWRQGFANLYRPNNQTLILVVTIGLGTTFLGTLYFVHELLLDRVRISAGTGQGNMLLFDVQPSKVAGVRKLAEEMKAPLVQDVPVVTARIASINGRTSDGDSAAAGQERGEAPRGDRGGGAAAQANRERGEAPPETRVGRGVRRGIGGEMRLSYRDTLTKTEKLVAGKLGPPVHSPRDVIYVSWDEDLAKQLGVQLGDTVGFDVQGLPVRTVVGSFRHIAGGLGMRLPMVFPSGVLEQAPQFRVMMLEAPTPEVSAHFQRAVVQRFPGVSVVDLVVVLGVLRDILGKIGSVIRFMAGFSMLTGVIVLVASVLVSKFQRIQESVLLRTLGASRRQVLVITMLEYFFLGGLASVVGIGLSLAFTLVLAKLAFELVFIPDWWVAGGLFAGVSALTVLIGLYNVRGVLNRPPLEVLRREG